MQYQLFRQIYVHTKQYVTTVTKQVVSFLFFLSFMFCHSWLFSIFLLFLLNFSAFYLHDFRSHDVVFINRKLY